MKKIMFVVMAIAIAVSVMAAQADVVKQLLPDADLKVIVFNLTPENIAAVQAAMGNKMPVRAQYEIYVSKTGAVVIEEQMGKWGIIKTAVLIDPATKKFKYFAIISMAEKRGAGLKTAAFIKQFIGKGRGDSLEIGKGVKAVSGATGSSKAIATTVKRALVIYDIFLAGSKK